MIMDQERSDTSQPTNRDWQITLHERIDRIPADDWNRCAGGINPMQSHGFLKALEDSHSASAEQGWMPRHITLEDQTGHIHGVMPLYIKSHS